MILWGKNPAVTSIHMLPFIREARSRGARVVLIDPVSTESRVFADEVVQPRPGTDGALALAMAQVIIAEGLWSTEFVRSYVHGFEEFQRVAQAMPPERAAEICDLPAARIRRLAREYACTRPASIWVGFGLQRHAGGGGAVRAIDALTAITGNIGVPGGGTNYSHRNTKRTRALNGREFASAERAVDRASLGSSLMGLEDPGIEVAVVARSNPLCQSPHTRAIRDAFERISTVIVIDQFMTDTAREADIFLPCTTFLEEEDVYLSYWHNFVAFGPRVVEPLGESRSDLSIFTALAARLGFGRHFERSPREWLEYALEPMARGGLTLERLEAEGAIRDPNAPMVPWSDRAFRTPSGRLELLSESGTSGDEDPLPSYIPPAEPCSSEYPLTLITPQPRWRTHSQFDQVVSCRDDSGPPGLRIHPSTAAAGGICDGDRVRLRSPRGEVDFVARLDPTVRPDVVVAPNGRPGTRGGGVNLLTGEYLTDIGRQAAFYDCGCAVEKLR
jgi:anaerobic selenocysteine-containing dehydrogenase